MLVGITHVGEANKGCITLSGSESEKFSSDSQFPMTLGPHDDPSRQPRPSKLVPAKVVLLSLVTVEHLNRGLSKKTG